MDDKYDATIDSSPQKSIVKALELLNCDNDSKHISRPDIRYKTLIFKATAIILGFILIASLALFSFVKLGTIIYSIFCVIALLLYVIFTLKAFIVLAILFYQKAAPKHIRQSCLFIPSCSVYMLLAINKYGLIKGVFKGIKRLLRCHPPNGGVDNP